METANVHMQSYLLAPPPATSRTPVERVRAFVTRGGGFWCAAGVVSLVLHASLPMLGGARSVLPEERVSIELVSMVAPVAPLPVESLPVDEPVENDIPRGHEGPPDAPLGAPVEDVIAPATEVANVVDLPDEANAPDRADADREDPAPPDAPKSEPALAFDPTPVESEPIVDEAAHPPEEQAAVEVPVVVEPSSTPQKFVRLPTLARERGVPSRSVQPRVRPRGPTKTRVASDAQRHGARGDASAAPPAALKEGEPDDIWACEVGDRGIRAQVKKERPITDWVTLLPTALFAYPTTPSLTDYLGGVAQVTSRQRRHVPRVGKWEFAMPRGEVEVTLEQPLGVRAYLGRNDARCLVGFESTKLDFFPMTLKRVPVRVVDEEGHEVRLLADVRFHKDARFELIARNEGEKVPFEEGLLENASLIERTVDAHMGTAKTFSSVASFFGFDVEKMMVDEQKRRMKALRAREAKASQAAAATTPAPRR